MKAKLIFLVVPVLFVLAGQSQAQSKITADKIGDKIEIRINGNLLTNYILSEHEKYPFFYPVNGPSKASVTSMRNANYPHHSSLFFGCDRVNGGNYWQEGLVITGISLLGAALNEITKRRRDQRASRRTRRAR